MTDTASRVPAGPQDLAGAFVDALWLEEGLSRNTLEAYRRDLVLFGEWLVPQGKTLLQATEADINAYFAARHAQTRASTANRRLTVLRRYFRWALRERFIDTDPTLRLMPAKQALRVPHTLSEAQVEALLNAPDTGTALGLREARRALTREGMVVGAPGVLHG